MTSPKTSSITAAPMIVRASRLLGYSDGRSGQGRANEDRDLRQAHALRLRPQSGIGEVPVAGAKREGHDDANRGNRRRGRTHAEHLLQVGLQSDLKQENDDADFGEQVNRLGHRVACGRWHDAQHAATHNDPTHQFAQHCRLPNALR